MKDIARKSLLDIGRKATRILLGYRILDCIQTVCPSERFGSNYGGWTVCPILLDSSSIIYSAGVGEDVSFDLGLIERFGLQVYAFDPTPKALAWARSQSLPENLHLYDWGVASHDGTTQFFPPENADHVSHSIIRRNNSTGNPLEVPVKRISTIMKELGHSSLSILKMDIEGAEYDVIEDLVKSSILPTQLLIEFHHRFEPLGIRKTISAIKRLNRQGYKIFSLSPNHQEYSFILKGSIGI